MATKMIYDMGHVDELKAQFEKLYKKQCKNFKDIATLLVGVQDSGDTELIDVFMKLVYSHFTPILVDNLVKLGRGEILEELVIGINPMDEALRRLPIAKQKELYGKPVAVISKVDHTMTQVSYENVTTAALAQVFDKKTKMFISTDEQLAKLKTEAATVTPKTRRGKPKYGGLLSTNKTIIIPHNVSEVKRVDIENMFRYELGITMIKKNEILTIANMSDPIAMSNALKKHVRGM